MRPASPTMTMHTKAATDEIYDMFNQPLKRTDSCSDGSDANEEDDDFNEASELYDDQS